MQFISNDPVNSISRILELIRNNTSVFLFGTRNSTFITFNDIPEINLILDDFRNTTRLNRSEIVELIDIAGIRLFEVTYNTPPELILQEVIEDTFELIDLILNQPDELLSESQKSSNSLTKYYCIFKTYFKKISKINKTSF